jgi:competence protein ComEC
VALSFSAEALAEDCTRAAIVVSQRRGPAACEAILIDRQALRESGAVTLRQEGKTYIRTQVRPPGLDRPWARHVEAEPLAAPRGNTDDATPRENDLEPGD